MPIHLNCGDPDCGASFSVDDSQQGTVVPCIRCRLTIAVPAPRATAATPKVAKPKPPPLNARATVDRATPPTLDKQTDERIAPAIPPLAKTKPLTHLGRFQIRERLGAGAFGTVYRAHDPQLDREVALKVPNPGVLDSPKRVERFLREARSAAQLRHPFLVPVFEAGEADGRLFIASAFIDGKTLSASIPLGGMEIRRAAAIVWQLADATAYAHDQKIVHRDIKPANIILDKQDRPHLLDFGLAAREDELEKLTHDGAILGTPAYMPPEQAAGHTGEVRPAVDQYALGVVLYELLTGKVPFAGPPAVVLHLVMTQEPMAPRTLRQEISRDLETICLKAMAKRPEDRYTTCSSLAFDLRRWLEGEPIRARQQGLGERLGRWVKREPLVTGLAAGLVLISVIAMVVIGALYRDAKHQAREVIVEAERKEEAERQFGEERTASQQHHKLFVDATGRAETAEEHVTRVRKQTQDAEFRAAAAEKRLETMGEQVAAAELSADAANQRAKKSESAAKAETEKRERAEKTAMQLMLTLKGHEGAVRSVAWSPDGKRIASASDDKTVRIWDAEKDRDLVTLKGHGGPVISVVWSPDGKRIASASMDDTVKVWEPQRGKEVRTLKGASNRLCNVAWSPDSQRLVLGSGKNTLKVWEAKTGRDLLTLKGHTSAALSVAWSSDGKRIASGSHDETAKLWDAETGKQLLDIWLGGDVTNLAWSPDGKRIVSISQGWARLWNAQTGRNVLSLAHPAHFVSGVAWSPDGKRIVTGSRLGRVKVWDAEKGQLLFAAWEKPARSPFP